MKATTLEGKVVLITGSTSGIGRVTAKELADMAATVVFVARNREKAAETAKWIKEETENPAVDFLQADLSSRDEVRAVADRFKTRYDGPDVLVNNAGAFFAKRTESADGIEMTFAVNHLAPFLLTNLLLESMKGKPSARIVTVSSHAHEGAAMSFEDLQGLRHYSGWRAYGLSKLANLLFTFELARRLEGLSVTANALHPGFVATGFGRNSSGLIRAAMAVAQRFGAISPEEGAETSVYLASAPDAEGVSGKYFVKKKPVPSSPASRDVNAMERLWKISAEMAHLPILE